MRRWCKEKKNGKKNQVEMVYVEDGSGQEGRMWIANQTGVLERTLTWGRGVSCRVVGLVFDFLIF